jgi:hypothetical protein
MYTNFAFQLDPAKKNKKTLYSLAILVCDWLKPFESAPESTSPYD